MLRSLGGATILVALYYLLPLRGPFNVNAIVLLSVLLIVFVVVAVWEVRAIAGSPTPLVRAIQALTISIPMLLLSFALTYFLMARLGSHEFSQSLTRSDSLYFTVTVFSTVGFGDIVPVSESARIVVMAQMLIDLIVLGLGVRVILQAVQKGESSRGGSGSQ